MNKNERRIAMLCFSHSVDDGRVAFRESVALKKAGYRVRIIGRSGKDGVIGGQRVYGIPALAISRRYTKNVVLRVLLEPFSVVRFFFVCLKYSKNVDVLHCHEYQSLLIALILKKFRKQKIVYDCHEFQPELLGETFFKCASLPYRLVCSVASYGENLLSKRCDGIITVNEFLKGRFQKVCGNVCLFPNYPSKRVGVSSKIAPHLFRQIEQIAQNKKMLTFLGGLAIDRGVLRVLDLMKRIVEKRQDIHLMLCGAVGDEGFWKKQISDRGLTDFVTMTGRFSYSDYKQWLSLADIGFYLPDTDSWQINHACATKVFQYCSAGIPSVLADNSAHRSLLTKSAFALIADVTNLDDIVMKTELLLGDEALRKKMGEAAKKMFDECWNAEAVEARLLNFYKLNKDRR